MKVLISVCFFVLLATFTSSTFLPVLNNNNNAGPRICVIRANNCGVNTAASRVCGRFGQSNLCKNFPNSCQMQKDNCAQTAQYVAVNGTMCDTIAVNQRTTCNGLAATNTNNGGGFLTNLFGNKKNNVVQPIIIRRG